MQTNLALVNGLCDSYGRIQVAYWQHRLRVCAQYVRHLGRIDISGKIAEGCNIMLVKIKTTSYWLY